MPVWALWLLALLGVIALLLSIPLHLSFHVQRSESWRVTLAVSWLFGLVSFPLAPPRRKAKPKPGQPRSARRRRRGRWTWRALSKPVFRRRLHRLLSRLLATIRLRQFALRLRLGLADPADTGMAWGILGAPLSALLLSARPGARLDLAPEFSGESLEVDARGRLTVAPARLVWVAGSFALSPVTWYAIWESRS